MKYQIIALSILYGSAIVAGNCISRSQKKARYIALTAVLYDTISKKVLWEETNFYHDDTSHDFSRVNLLHEIKRTDYRVSFDQRELLFLPEDKKALVRVCVRIQNTVHSVDTDVPFEKKATIVNVPDHEKLKVAITISKVNEESLMAYTRTTP